MALLKTPNTTPSGGYRYRQKETQLVIRGDSLQDLTRKVIEHRTYRSLPNTDPREVGKEIQRQICASLGTDQCYAEKDDTWLPIENSSFIRLSDIMAFSKSLLEWVRVGQLVEEGEALARRKICADCPMNFQPSGCKCGLIYKMIAQAVPKSRQYQDLHVCKVCRCSLRAKVNAPLSVIQKADEGRALKYPDHCWLAHNNIASQ